jgi:hypothetical protein
VSISAFSSALNANDVGLTPALARLTFTALVVSFMTHCLALIALDVKIVSSYIIAMVNFGHEKGRPVGPGPPPEKVL